MNISLYILIALLIKLVNCSEDGILWASTGGGWRAMCACIGFANVFHQVGLLSETSSQFSAVSTVSGASWFSAQLFYSDEFYKNMMGTPDDIQNFVTSWMNSYLALNENVTENESCSETIIKKRNRSELYESLCNLLIEFNGDWAEFVASMLEAASKDFGDPEFTSRKCGEDNRVAALKETDLLIQSSLAPNSRQRSTETAIYLGPSGGSDLYSVVLPATYVVNKNGGRFVIGSSSSLEAYNGPTTEAFSLSEWENFYMYPGTNGTIEIANTFEASTKGYFREPFNGSTPNTVQVASISSAALGPFSPLIPSVFSQTLSTYRYESENSDSDTVLSAENNLKLFDNLVNVMYKSSTIDNAAVCSQWPKKCKKKDGYFIDGWLVENPALAINIGQYQNETNFDLTKKIKVVLTNTNQKENSTFTYQQILAYFSTTFNQGVKPGDFGWVSSQYLPWPSPQIFEEYLDEDALKAMLKPVAGTNMTTALIDATTLTNPVYGTREGQKVQVLVVFLNEDITTYIVGTEAVKRATPKLAQMAYTIASSQDLVSQVRDFFNLNDMMASAPKETSKETSKEASKETSEDTKVSSGYCNYSVFHSTILFTLFVALLY